MEKQTEREHRPKKSKLAAMILAHAEAAKNIKTAAAENKSNTLQHSASCAFFHVKKAGNQFSCLTPF
jgi:fibrillarin-like rRNA methylase